MYGYEAPRQCPLVLVKVIWRGGKTLGSIGDRDEKRSKERNRNYLNNI
jgi:hypothetical protein